MPFKNKENNHKQQKNLSLKITTSLILIVICITFFTSTVLYIFFSIKSKEQYLLKSTEYLDYLKENLELPLWNMDEGSITKICKSFSKNEEIVVLIVMDYKDSIVFSKKLSDSGNEIIKKTAITHNNEMVGNITLGLTKKIYESKNLQLLLTTFLTMTMVILGLSLSARLIIDRLLQKPLDSLLERIKLIQEGNYGEINSYSEHDEFFTILDNFNQMSSQVELREKELKKINEKLKFEILERERAESSLKDNEKFLEAIVENIPDMIFVKDAEELRFVRFNRSGEELLGYSREDMIGKNDYDFFPEKEADFFTGKDMEVLDKGLPVDIPEEPIQTRLKGERILRTKKIPILNEEKQPVYLLGISEDITDQKQIEQQLRQAQKIESLGNLAGGIAHDFNNLLFPITGMAEMLLEDLPNGSAEHKNINEILKAGKRGSELVKQILAFSRQSDHKLIPVQIQQVLKEVLRLSRSTIPSDIEIQEDVQPDCGFVLADSTQIHQIAMNLITNSYHAIGQAGGKIFIRLKESILDTIDLIGTALEPGKYATLEITDTGCGIDPGIKDKIFDPYFTTKEKEKGTGLGLSVVYGIVMEHGGDVQVESALEHGTTFTVHLPLIEQTSEKKPAAKPEISSNGTERVLLIDDEAPIVNLEKLMLERFGYKATSFTSSVDALNAFKAQPDVFDIVITDMTMPNMTGDQLSKEILSIRPDIPIIICTGFSDRINKDRAEDEGIKGFLMKPVVMAEMARMIRQVLDENAT